MGPQTCQFLQRIVFQDAALSKLVFQKLNIRIRRVRYSLRADSHLEPACKLYSNEVHEVFCATSVEIYFVNRSRWIFVFQCLDYTSAVAHIL